MKYISAIVIVAALAAAPAFAQVEAVFSSVSGKVETREAGGSWQPVSEGQSVARGTTVSTGFNASAAIQLGDSSIEVESLTRLTLEELVRQADTVTTRAFMDVGEVNASVQSAEGLTNDFEVRSAQVTAAVRGTNFSFDGRSVFVSEGLVALVNQVGVGTIVAQNQQSSSGGTGAPSDPEEETTGQFNVSANTDPGSEGDGGDDDLPESIGDTVPVFIEIEW